MKSEINIREHEFTFRMLVPAQIRKQSDAQLKVLVHDLVIDREVISPRLSVQSLGSSQQPTILPRLTTLLPLLILLQHLE